MTWDHLNSVLDDAANPDDIETDVDPTEPSDEEARRQAGADLDVEDGKPKGNPPPTAIETLDSLLGRLRRGEGDTLFDVGDALKDFEVGPGLITAIGAPPGCGKTTLGMQAVFAAVSNQPKLRALVANAEMPLAVLLKRELTRRSGVPSRALRFADLTPHQLQSVESAAEELRPLLSRVESLSPPFTIGKLVTACSERPPGLVIVDYLQKFADGGSDARQGVNAVMTGLRQIASEGWAVLAMSATTRTKSTSGSGHDSKALTMASMKESGEIEFNADSIYLIRDQGLATDGVKGIHHIELDHCKNRHGPLTSIELVFDMPKSEFRKPDPEPHDFGEFRGDPFAGSAGNRLFDTAESTEAF